MADEVAPVVAPVVVPPVAPVAPAAPAVVAISASELRAFAVVLGMFMVLVAGGMVCLGLFVYYHEDSPVNPVPVVAVDPAFVKVGKMLAPTHAHNNATAWTNFATNLDKMPFSKALAQVGSDFNAARTADYDKYVSPAMEKIVPSGTADTAVTPAQITALKAAGNGLAKGLSGK